MISELNVAATVLTHGENKMRLMPVEVPLGTSHKTTPEKLARNVAALFGVPARDATAGTLVSKYEFLKLRDVGSGVPLIGRAAGAAALSGRPGEINEISSATLNRYRPDRKAATVLTGANYLFRTLTPVFSDVLNIIGDELHEEIRLAIWAILVHESYRSQPALFAAAVTARSVQRALTQDWAPYSPSGGIPGRTEFGFPDRAADDLMPRRLELLDDTVEEIKFSVGDRGSQRYLRQDLINRWTKYILNSDDRGFAWVVAGEEGGRSVETFAPLLGPLNSLIDEYHGSAEIAMVEGVYNKLLPRIPSPAALSRLDLRSQNAAIWAILQVHRLLRENPRFDDSSVGGKFQHSISLNAQKLADLSSEVLGQGHPLTVWSRAKWANKLINDYRETNRSLVDDALEMLQTEVGRMRALYVSREVSPGQFADFLRSISAIVSAVGDDARDLGDQARAQEIRAYVMQLWEWFFEALPFDPRDLLRSTTLDVDEPLVRLLVPHLHNYASVLARGARDEQLRALYLEEHFVIPARRNISGGDTNLKVALQVVARTFVRLADGAVGSNAVEERQTYANRVLPYLDELSRTRHGKEVLSDRIGAPRLRSDQINTLTALTGAFLLCAEQGVATRLVSLPMIRTLLERAQGTLRAYSSQDSGRLRQLQSQIDRLSRLELLAEDDSLTGMR